MCCIKGFWKVFWKSILKLFKIGLLFKSSLKVLLILFESILKIENNIVFSILKIEIYFQKTILPITDPL